MIEAVRVASDELLDAFKRLLPQLEPGLPGVDHERVQQVVSSACVVQFVARAAQSQSIVGLGTLVLAPLPTGMRAYAEDLVVAPEFRGRGIGELLCRAAFDHAAREGAVCVDGTADPQRVDANRLYERVGFQRRATIPYRYHAQGHSKRSIEPKRARKSSGRSAP